ncbi:MAG: hypothetical protein AVDCRST_MAG96-615 [uncultured Segetibacter sp.]|uniref:Uncharacterized protein n=1 Tax=uncultured Segetibacter sp. TaxID=481133 RepID=A0A6J4RP94_9BACT|nr:MAG: hypothetical protein AVDCRST_MAG96-615 [uncultured Segetibacter sp.]
MFYIFHLFRHKLNLSICLKLQVLIQPSILELQWQVPALPDVTPEG